MKFIILQFALQFTVENASEDASQELYKYIDNVLEFCGSPFSLDDESTFYSEDNAFDIRFLVRDPQDNAADAFKTHLQTILKDCGSPFEIECTMSDIVEGSGGFKAEFTKFNNESNWVKGVVKREDGTIISAFNVKLFDKPSDYGFLNGKGSKIDLIPSGGHFGDCFVHFDRNSWDVMPKEGVELQQLLAVYELCEASPKRFAY